MDIKNICEKIVGHLQKNKRPVAELLNIGLLPNKVESLLNEISIELPSSIKEMYYWRNGTRVEEGDALDDLHFFPGFYWLSLEDAIKSYKAFMNDNRWSKEWFPIFANGGGDFFAVLCSGDINIVGGIVGFILGEQGHSVEYENIESMLSTINTCFCEGVYFLSEEGYFDADDNTQIKIAKRYNPDLDFYSNIK